MTNESDCDIEYLDLVDDSDNVVGRLPREEIYTNRIRNFRVINCFVCKAAEGGEDLLIWVPRRHPQQKLFPMHLDASVGGHVQAGETYLEAFRRECFEEINVDIDNHEHEVLFKLNPLDHGVSAFMTVYQLSWNSKQDPDFSRKDITESFWMRPEDLLDLFRHNKEKAKSDLANLVSHLLEHIGG